MKLITTLFLFNLAIPAFAGSAHNTPPKVSDSFESMKALVGTWEGTTKMAGKDVPVKVTYEMTSGGTAMVEKIMPGTDHEMITVYANRGKDVNATHFCIAGNQPEMKLKKTTPNEFTFEMVGTKGIANKNDEHMHGVTLTLIGNKLKQEWTNYKKNKKADTTVFEFTKKI